MLTSLIPKHVTDHTSCRIVPNSMKVLLCEPVGSLKKSNSATWFEVEYENVHEEDHPPRCRTRGTLTLNGRAYYQIASV